MYPLDLLGPSVRLREVTGDDAPAAWRWAGDPEYFRFLPVAPPASEREERAFLERAAAAAREAPRTRYEVGVESRASGELLGMVRLGVVSWEHREGDLGYGLRPDARGHGFATEAAALIVAFGFAELGLHRIFATHHPDNTASQRVLERIGMRREGVLRDHRLCNGEWRDSVLWSILEHERPT